MGKFDWRSVQQNGALGTKLTLAAIRTVGGIYARKSSVPQHVENVREANDRAIRYIYALAMTGAPAGMVNVGALRLGINPKNHLTMPASAVTMLVSAAYGNYRASPRAFTITEDHYGQITVRPRYEKHTDTTGLRCPATNVKVAGPEHTKSGLLTFMQAVGSVAMAEVYPRQFCLAQVNESGVRTIYGGNMY